MERLKGATSDKVFSGGGLLFYLLTSGPGEPHDEQVCVRQICIIIQ